MRCILLQKHRALCEHSKSTRGWYPGDKTQRNFEERRRKAFQVREAAYWGTESYNYLDPPPFLSTPIAPVSGLLMQRWRGGRSGRWARTMGRSQIEKELWGLH